MLQQATRAIARSSASAAAARRCISTSRAPAGGHRQYMFDSENFNMLGGPLWTTVGVVVGGCAVSMIAFKVQMAKWVPTE